MRHPKTMLLGSAVALLFLTGAAHGQTRWEQCLCQGNTDSLADAKLQQCPCPDTTASRPGPADENSSSEAAASPRMSDEDRPITMDSNELQEK